MMIRAIEKRIKRCCTFLLNGERVYVFVFKNKYKDIKYFITDCACNVEHYKNIN